MTPEQEDCEHYFHQLPIVSFDIDFLCSKCAHMVTYVFADFKDIAGCSLVDLRKQFSGNCGYPCAEDEATFEQAREWVADIKAQRLICGNN